MRSNHIYHNFYYIPLEEFLNRKRAELEVQHWLNNLEREQRIMDTLRESEERYRTILEETGDGYFETDLAGNFTLVNDTQCRILGYSREELMGMNYKAFTPEENVKTVFEAYNRMYRTGEPLRGFTDEVIRKDGIRAFAEVAAFPLRDEEGTIVGFRGIRHDITERKRAEEGLRESEERYRTLFGNSIEAVFTVDIDGNFTSVNKAFEEWSGYSREEAIGMSYGKLVTPEQIDFIFKEYNKLFRTGEPIRNLVYECVLKDGERRLVEGYVNLIKKGDWIEGFQGTLRDITERKRQEEERRQLEQKAQVTSRLASVGEMAAGVAHEINNPLTGVIGYAQLLMDRGDIPSDIRRDLAAINDGAQRVASIVKRLLVFSRQVKPERRFIDINELIESTLALRAYHLRDNNIKVTTQLAPDLPETVADPGQLQQVLLNLIVNAETEMKLAHGKGKLTITTEKSDNTVKICVKDDGPGIKPEVMDRIFDPFFTTREVGQGTGLGLSLCHGIVAEHNGKTYAESKLGKGTTFIVELPIVTIAEPPEPAEPVVEEPEKVVKAKILVVDDEKVIRDFVKRVLAGEGYEVETVDNAGDALKKIEDKRYNLVLIDIKMPGMDGVELYKRIQKIAKSLARRVVFITGDIMGADTEKFLSETKAAHIDKPFNAEQLSREVNRALTGGR